MDLRSPDSAEAHPFHPLIGAHVSISLSVNDLQRSLAWYCHVVGFSIERTHEREGVLRAVSLRAGEVRVLIGQDDGARGLDRPKGEGFSLMITTEQSIDEVADAIKQHGGVLEADPVSTPWGARMFRLRDPDGFKWTISSPVAA